MVEVPSLLFQLDELLERVDFLSVGSNDLVQFFYAVDRGNARVSARFDELSPPVLRALKQIADKAKQHGKPVTLCGELASSPLGALALVGLGYRSLSLVPSAIGPVKAMLLELDAGKAEALVAALIDQADGVGLDPRQARRLRGGRRPADRSPSRSVGCAESIGRILRAKPLVPDRTARTLPEPLRTP